MKLFFVMSVFSSLSAVGAELTVKMLDTTCNSKYGFGQVEYAAYDPSERRVQIYVSNVVNSQWCSTSDRDRWSNLVDFAYTGMTGGGLIEIDLNENGIIKNIRNSPKSKKTSRLEAKFTFQSLLDARRRGAINNTVVDLNFLYYDVDASAEVVKLRALAESAK